MKKRECLLVLSSPRAGSSCVTACVHFCGLSIGAHPTTVKNQFNAKGYFENSAILRYNERTLSKIGMAWNKFHKVQGDKSSELLRLGRDELLKIIREQYGDKDFMIKDPRIATLWPVYKSVFYEFEISPKILHLKRHRADSCKSMMRMTNMDMAKSQKVYDGYYTLIDELAEIHPTHYVQFESFIKDPVAETEKICQFLGKDFTKRYESAVKDFVSHNLINFKEGHK